MKLGIVVGILLGIVILAISGAAVTVAAIQPLARQISSPSLTPVPAAISQTVTSSIPVSPSPSVVAPSAPPSNTAPNAGSKVSFNLSVTDFVVDGFSAHVTARVTNPGNGDAHNVQAQVRVTSAGSIVQVNDADSYTLSIGTLRSQQAVTVNTTLTFNILDTLKISSQGATVYLWLISDEKTETFSYDYHP